MDVNYALLQTLTLMSKVVPIMLVSLILSNALFSLPQFSRVGEFINNLIRFSKLKSGFAIASFLIHPIVGISSLSAMYRAGKLSFRETACSAALSMLPRGFRAALLFLAPVAVSVFGVEIGLLFVSLDLISRLVVFLILLLAARFTLKDGNGNSAAESDSKFSLKEVLKVFARTVAVLFVSTFLTFLIFQMNPGENVVLLVLFSGAMSTTAGMGTAATLIHSGTMDWRFALLLVYVSRLFHVFVESFRFSMPIFTSFFGVRDGVRLLAVYAASNFLAVALATLLFSAL
ncbi:hypothetical protein [Archaeoglobus sp.]|uniref:hypothetical protein n=1 Tax=Archaeoglobus sp. TaxID=1872626 RepID=UPI0024ABE58F|nr:hypothetical protein [Archaeoglobus sp.]MDI3496795.1 hypothetical protein [Archaeoglobus sp.]